MTREEATRVLEFDLDHTHNDESKWALRMAIKALEQQTCEDAVSRREALLAISNLYPCAPRVNFFRQLDKWCEEYEPFLRCEQAIKELPSVQPETTVCEDAVSRQAVLMELGKYLCGVPFDEKGIDEVIKELPPVNPQPKVGHWIEQIDHEENCRTLICSNCDRPALHDENSIWKHKFCPHCGAKMVEPQESEDLGDYPDTIRNQFDNMTGSMNL